MSLEALARHFVAEGARVTLSAGGRRLTVEWPDGECVDLFERPEAPDVRQHGLPLDEAEGGA